jgi:type VI secretion system protein ImpH
MPSLSDDLLARGSRYSYFQAIRLMRRAGATRIRVRPNLSLGFPDTDIDAIERLPAAQAIEDSQSIEGGDGAHAGVDAYRVTANFFGLYGVSSPLPTFYTEDLIDDHREGRHARREFLDILHGALYPQLFEAWRKYRLQLRAVEEGDPDALDMLYAFAGLGSVQQRESLPGAGGLLRYLNLFAQRTRSAMGLRTLLADAFAPATIDVESCEPQWVPIPRDQRLRLGLQAHALGQDCPLGVQVQDSDNLLHIVIGDLPEALFQQLLPGAQGHRTLQFLVRFYLTRPLQVSVELRLKKGEGHGARAGAAEWSRLGLDTWLPGEQAAGPSPARFRLAPQLVSPTRTSSHAAG